MDGLVSKIIEKFQIGVEFNILKFHTDDPKISFLSYPRFFEEPHPALNRSITIDLRNGKSHRTEYSANLNPPILHRKETLLSADHPRRTEFEDLTEEEENAGLYEKTSTIGFKLNWEKLLTEKGVSIHGHTLVKVAPSLTVNTPSTQACIHRHKTAITRYDLSKPVKSLLEYGLLKQDTTFFDYGCGQGSDIRGLRTLGYVAEGWDPVHKPDAQKREANIVNLGYVVNVIEDPVERLETLVDSYRYARKLLVVSALIHETVERSTSTVLGDGVLTKRNTFQKYFEQGELRQYIEDALDLSAIPIALGIFYVFRLVSDQQDFLATRMRHDLDWTDISTRIGLGEPKIRKPRWKELSDQHHGLLDEFWRKIIQIGRIPSEIEFPGYRDIKRYFGSTKQALKTLLAQGGQKQFEAAQEQRRSELLVYLALANLKKRIPFGLLSLSLRLDIRAFWKDYQQAMEAGLKLLYRTGDPLEIKSACEKACLGWQDEQALYIHRSLLGQVPPVLRTYVGCATTLSGDVGQGDIIKIHKNSSKVSFLAYDDFDGKVIPELQHRIKVNLKARSVDTFDHSSSGQCLFFKEKYVSPNHPQMPKMKAFSAKLRKVGITDQAAINMRKADFVAVCQKLGLNSNLNKARNSGNIQRRD